MLTFEYITPKFSYLRRARLSNNDSQIDNSNYFALARTTALWSHNSDQAKFAYTVVILANLTKYNDEQIKRLKDFPNYEIFDFEKTYNKLVFPLCSGTYLLSKG